MKLNEEQIRAATKDRISRALNHIQRAQDELTSACNMLSALEHGDKEHHACLKQRECVYQFWYKIQALQRKHSVRLDRTNIEALEQNPSLSSWLTHIGFKSS